MYDQFFQPTLRDSGPTSALSALSNENAIEYVIKYLRYTMRYYLKSVHSYTRVIRKLKCYQHKD